VATILRGQSGGNPVIYFGFLYGLGVCMIPAGFIMKVDDWINNAKLDLQLFRVNLSYLFLGITSTAILVVSDILYLHRTARLPPYINLIVFVSSDPVEYSYVHFNIVYSLLPWLGIYVLGILAGKLLVRKGSVAYTYGLCVGIASCTGFVAMRVWGTQWIGPQEPVQHEITSQFWCTSWALTQFPPSSGFVLCFLGLNLITLFIISRCKLHQLALGKTLVMFGKAPLFFYIVHLFVFLALCLLWNRDEYGLPMHWTYLIWILGLWIMFPICNAFAKWKRRQEDSSIWRFF